MKKPKQPKASASASATAEPMEEDEEQYDQQHQREATDTVFNDKSDICQQLLDRYVKSSAQQHRHLCATAAATRWIIQSESLPLTPLSYFAATIGAIADASKTLDANAVSALSAFLSIVLPLVPDKSIAPAKAAEAMVVLLELVERPSDAVTTASVRAVVKSLGILVRKCAQDCLMKTFKSFKSSTVVKKASKVIFSLLKSHMTLAVKLSASRAVDGPKDDTLSNSDHLGVLHMLNVLKHTGPHLSVKVSLKVLSEFEKLMGSQFSPLTRHIFNVIIAIFDVSGAEIILPQAESILRSLVAYVSLGGKNPIDTVLSAATLSKRVLDRFHASGGCLWINLFPLVFTSIAGLLTFEAGTASLASNILKDIINEYIDRRNLLPEENQQLDDGAAYSMEAEAIKSTCAFFDDVLSACDGIPNEHILAVISTLFLKLGGVSYFHMKSVLLKLAGFMNIALKDTSDTKHLQECLGSAIVAMGPEKSLTLLPVSLNAEDFSCSNIWLLPLLKKYAVGSSLGFFIEHMVPLAKSFQQASHKAKKSVIRQEMLAHANICWGLLTVFCLCPTDTCQNFGPLAKLIIPFLKKDSLMLESIAIALQELVVVNRSVLRSNQGPDDIAWHTKAGEVTDSARESESKPFYSKKTASRNVKVLASCSEELLQALTDVLLESLPEKRAILKGTIGCLTSIADSSVSRKIFISSLKRLDLTNALDDPGMPGNNTNASIDKELSCSTSKGKDARRNLMLELASSIVEGASEDLINLIFNFIRQTLQESGDMNRCEAYYSLSRILEEHSWFCRSLFTELMDLLVALKSPADVASFRSRLACFKALLIYLLKSSDEDDAKAFLVLNEIIITLKDSKEEYRKVAYDNLISLCSRLRNLSDATSNEPYHKLISMIMGYLSGSSPHIKSGAVSALSLLIYNDIDICILMPDLVSSVLELLQSKAVEVIKAALGFVKVLVSCIQAKDLQNFLSDILNGVFPCSSISRHHFRSKVTVILEIMIRKCGSPAIESLTPEKYKNFVKTVLENRRGKTRSNETKRPSDMETKLSDSSFKGQQKRKHKETGISPSEDNSGESRKKKRVNKQKGTAFSRNEPKKFPPGGDSLKSFKKVGHSSYYGRPQGQSQLSRRHKRWNSNKNALGGKRETERIKVSKRNESEDHRPHVTSKLRKRRGKNGLKINK